AQVKLLRALQERSVTRVGDTVPRDLDVRVIAATHRDLAEEVRTGRFREDLYYRLNVIPIALPALRERREDIPLLIERFIAKFNQEQGKQISGFAPEALRLLLDYRFPGNVRELENLVERCVTLADGQVLGPGVLPADLGPSAGGELQPLSVPEQGM